MSDNMSAVSGDDGRQATCEQTSRSMERWSHNQRQDTIREFRRIEDESAGTMKDLQLEEVQRLQSLAPPEDTSPSTNDLERLQIKSRLNIQGRDLASTPVVMPTPVVTPGDRSSA